MSVGLQRGAAVPGSRACPTGRARLVARVAQGSSAGGASYLVWCLFYCRRLAMTYRDAIDVPRGGAPCGRRLWRAGRRCGFRRGVGPVAGRGARGVGRDARGKWPLCVAVFCFYLKLVSPFYGGNGSMKMCSAGAAGAAPGAWEALLRLRWGCPRWPFFRPSGVEVGVR